MFIPNNSTENSMHPSCIQQKPGEHQHCNEWELTSGVEIPEVYGKVFEYHQSQEEQAPWLVLRSLMDVTIVCGSIVNIYIYI